MTDYMTDSREERLSILRELYPLYKEEVYRRREQMIRITAWGSAFLLCILLASLWAPNLPWDRALGILAIAGLITFSLLLMYLIIQQRDRHRMAKQSLIEIERALGLYQEGFYLAHKALYPQNWQTAWLGDRSVILYISAITILTALIVAAIELRISG